MTLTISAAKVRHMIGCARRLEQVAADLSAALDADGGRHDAMAMYFESPTRRALVDFVATLSAAERQDLVALMWLGRGDAAGGRGDWEALRAEARRLPRGDDALTLVGRNRLSFYLEIGLKKLSGPDPELR